MNPQEEVNTIASTASSLQVESVVVKQEKDVIKSTSADSVVKVASSSSSPSNASQVKTYAVRVVPASIPTTPTSTTTAQEAMKDDLGLVAACEKGSLKAVKFLLEQHPDYYNDINKIYVGLYGVSVFFFLV